MTRATSQHRKGRSTMLDNHRQAAILNSAYLENVKIKSTTNSQYARDGGSYFSKRPSKKIRVEGSANLLGNAGRKKFMQPDHSSKKTPGGLTSTITRPSLV